MQVITTCACRVLCERMRKLYSGGWTTHSVLMLTDYLKEISADEYHYLLLPWVCHVAWLMLCLSLSSCVTCLDMCRRRSFRSRGQKTALIRLSMKTSSIGPIRMHCTTITRKARRGCGTGMRTISCVCCNYNIIDRSGRC